MTLIEEINALVNLVVGNRGPNLLNYHQVPRILPFGLGQINKSLLSSRIERADNLTR